MNFTYITAINAFVIMWCIITIGLLWSSWDEVGAKAKTAVAFATPVMVYSLILAGYFFGKDMYADKTYKFWEPNFSF
jgi:hypothetical protein